MLYGGHFTLSNASIPAIAKSEGVSVNVSRLGSLNWYEDVQNGLNTE